MQQFLPSKRIPGFAFHQSERTDDNGTAPCTMDTDLCYDMNARDFDFLGYKFSLLSSIGTAGLNNVLCMIPARDQEEYALFPEEDLEVERQSYEELEKCDGLYAESTVHAPARQRSRDCPLLADTIIDVKNGLKNQARGLH